MLTQAVLLISGPGLDPGRPDRAAAWLDGLVANIARHGLDDILILDAAGLGRAFDSGALRRFGDGAAEEPGSPPLRPATVTARAVGDGDAGDLEWLRSRLDERFLLVDAGRFFDINYLDLLTFGGDAAVTLARPSPGDATPDGWGGVAVVRRDALADVGLAGDLVSRLLSTAAPAGRRYDRPLVGVGEPDATAKLAALMHRPAVFLDRDGVLNVDREYVSRVDQFEWIPGAREAVKLFNDAGWYVFVVTNQSGIARGLYPESAVGVLHAHMAAELQAVGAHLDRIEYCPFHDEGTIAAYRRLSPRRKPGPGMLLSCFDAFPVDRRRSFLVGDKATDLAAAEAAGIAGHLFGGGSLLDFVAPLLAGSAG